MCEIPRLRVYYTSRRAGEGAGARRGGPGHDSMKRMLVAVAAAGSLWATGGFAQAGATLTIDPAMTRGPATAPVTIVEFSDYQ